MWTVTMLVVITVWTTWHVNRCPGCHPSFVVVVMFICHRGCSFIFVVHCGLLHHWRQRGSCFWCEKGAGQGGLWCSPQPCPLFVYITCCCCWSIVGCCITVLMWPLLFEWENERGLLLTWNYGDSDDDRRRHRLDDVARLLTCQVVTMSCRASSSWWRGNAMLLLLLLACMVVVGGGRTVVAEGGGGRKLFVCWCCVSAVLGKCHSRGSYIR